MPDLAALASALPNVTRGVACAGTALECQTFATNKKAFLFLSKKELRLKLGASTAEAKAAGFVVGANGWVKVPIEALPPAAVMKRWLTESHASMAPKAKPARTRSQAGKRASGRGRRVD